MIAAFGANNVRCADYATYGTKELSLNAIKALEGAIGMPAGQSRRHRHRLRPR